MGQLTLTQSRPDGHHVWLDGTQGLLRGDALSIMNHELWVLAVQVSAGPIQHHQNGPTRATVKGALGRQSQCACHALSTPNQQDLAAVTLVRSHFSFERACERKGIEGLDQGVVGLSGFLIEL